MEKAYGMVVSERTLEQLEVLTSKYSESITGVIRYLVQIFQEKELEHRPVAGTSTGKQYLVAKDPELSCNEFIDYPACYRDIMDLERLIFKSGNHHNTEISPRDIITYVVDWSYKKFVILAEAIS